MLFPGAAWAQTGSLSSDSPPQQSTPGTTAYHQEQCGTTSHHVVQYDPERYIYFNNPITAGSRWDDINTTFYWANYYGDIIDDITKLFRSGHNDEAAAAIPDELLDDAAIIGNNEHVRGQISRWEASGVTMLVVNADSDEALP